ncbi:MAG: heavy-metal-associated domain-containing protein [Flavobacteriales bacterium]
MKHILFLILIFITGQTLSAQKPVTTTFWVAGVCDMCEKSIESAMDTKGIVKADFSLDNNMLTVTFKPSKIIEQEIHALLNEAGYDTEKSICSEEQYARVHGCCKYRELEKH